MAVNAQTEIVPAPLTTPPVAPPHAPAHGLVQPATLPGVKARPASVAMRHGLVGAQPS